MLLIKKIATTILCLTAVLFFNASASMAAVYQVEINVSGLENADLAGFDLDLNYDDASLTFDTYVFTDELGSFDLGDVGDYSYGDNGAGVVNLCAISNLSEDDAVFDGQSASFVLATLTFIGDSLGEGFSLTIGSVSDNAAIDIESIIFTINVTTSPVPVPSAFALMSLGLMGLAGLSRKCKN